MTIDEDLAYKTHLGSKELIDDISLWLYPEIKLTMTTKLSNESAKSGFLLAQDILLQLPCDQQNQL